MLMLMMESGDGNVAKPRILVAHPLIGSQTDLLLWYNGTWKYIGV